MDENVNTVQEAAAETVTTETAQTADQPDGFLEGFDDEEAVAEMPADQPEEAAESAESGDEGQTGPSIAPDAKTDASPKPEDTDKAAEEKPPAKTWDIKHMGQQFTVTEDQITPELLQKAYDYDRVRGKYDEAKPVMEIFSELARSAGMNVADFAKSVRMEAKKAQGMTDADARRAVELEDREAAVSAAEAAKAAEEKERSAKNAQIREDLAMFERAFPDAYNKARGGDKTAIPQSVWDEVNRGVPLVAAYSRYVAAQAAESVKAAETKAAITAKNAANAARSSGSMKSAGNDAKTKDEFLSAFEG